MNQTEIIENTKNFVKQSLQNAEGGHDWFHIQRVLKNAQHIAINENVDNFIVTLGALLHDIADSKFHNGNEKIGPEKASIFLKEQGVSEEIIEHVVRIIENISFKGGNEEQTFRSPELDVIQDADRLDAIGAIGIARTFNYGGFKGRALYDPDIEPDLGMSKAAYKSSSAPTINHFYEKLLLLKGRMHTKTGRQIAADRHKFMEEYLNQFYKEWNGEL
jgi:uncharacterized protein